MKIVRGRWTETLSGGSCDFSTWRDNPQFMCDAPNRATRVLVTLRLLPSSKEEEEKREEKEEEE
jgi:hypothetical protein